MTDSEKSDFAEQLKLARESAGLTQVQLAEIIGTTKQHIYQWETGKVRPSAKYIWLLEQALSNTASDLIHAYVPVVGSAKAGKSLNNLAVEEARLLIEMVGEMKARGEEIPESVKKRLKTQVDKLLS